MMNRAWGHIACVIALVAGMSCSKSTKDSACNSTSDCGEGYACVEKVCKKLCFTQQDCQSAEVCLQGVCNRSVNGPLPQISSVAGNNTESPQRVNDGLMIDGAMLATAVFELRDQTSNATSLTIRSQSEARAEVLLPANVRKGAYQLVATNTAGSAMASVTLELPDLSGDLLVERINTQATTPLSLSVMPTDVLARLTALEDRSCPPGYTRDTTRTDIVLCINGADEMVKVGDFWVDRYEGVIGNATFFNNGSCYGSVCADADPNDDCFSDGYPDTFPKNGQVKNQADRLYACSVKGMVPSRSMTWFQAAQACAASGKHLLTNAEWQIAVSGTPDPGAWPNAQGNCGADPISVLNQRNCNTCSSGLVASGNSLCASQYGAEDMIGNLYEWTADWWQAGKHVDTELPGAWDPSIAVTTNWPDASYGSDTTFNLYGRAYNTSTAKSTNSLAAAAQRGGCWSDGEGAGAFALTMYHGVSSYYAHSGFRCARR